MSRSRCLCLSAALLLCTALSLFAQNSSYSFSSPVVINHTKVPNSDQINFPIGFIGNYAWLADVGHGGHVQSAQGFDIVFCTNQDGTGLLDFELGEVDLRLAPRQQPHASSRLRQPQCQALANAPPRSRHQYAFVTDIAQGEFFHLHIPTQL